MRPIAESVADRKPAVGKLDHLRIRKGHHGSGHIVEHHHEGKFEPHKTVVFGKQDGAKLLAHVATHMGIPGAAEEANEPEHEA